MYQVQGAADESVCKYEEEEEEDRCGEGRGALVGSRGVESYGAVSRGTEQERYVGRCEVLNA